MTDPGDLDLACFHLNHAGGNASSADVESLADTFATCREEGAAALFGLIEMAKVIAARERARPMDIPDDSRGCYRRKPGTQVRCNLMNDHGGAHKFIGSRGVELHSWAAPERDGSR